MLRFSPDGAKIAVGDAGREIKVWEIGKPEPVITRKWMAHQSTVTTICWAPEGDRLVSGSVDGRIVVWNMSKPREINERPQIHPGGVFCVDWADNNVVYTCGDDACVREVQLVMCSVCATKKLSVFCEYNKSFVKQRKHIAIQSRDESFPMPGILSLQQQHALKRMISSISVTAPAAMMPYRPYVVISFFVMPKHPLLFSFSLQPRVRLLAAMNGSW